MKKLLILSIISIVLFSCNSKEHNEPNSNNNSLKKTKKGSKYRIEDIFYTNVENLRLREKPNLPSKTISTLKENTKLLSLFEHTSNKDTIQMGKDFFIEHWYKVQVFDTKDTGWVFGGGISINGQTADKLLSIDDLKKLYQDLPDDCHLIFNYIFPNSSTVQNIINENQQIQLQKIDFNQLPFLELFTEVHRETNDTKDHLFSPYKVKNTGLFPIFETKEGEVKMMFGDFFFSDIDKKWSNWFEEKQIIEEDKYDINIIKEHVKFSKIEEELNSKNYIINVITNKRVLKARMLNYEEYADECLAYSSVTLNDIELEENEYPLYGSFHEVDIDYQISKTLGKKFRSFIQKSCFDCGNNIHDLKVVARVSNTDIYLVANNIHEMEELDTHNRSIYYITKEIALGLQHEEIDYFGCPCL